MKAVLFYDPTFPLDGCAPNTEALQKLNSLFKVTDAEGLSAALKEDGVNCLVHLHGSYFPKASWPEILAFVKRGGGLIHAGGAPFKLPVSRDGEQWDVQQEMTAYHQELFIHEALAVDHTRSTELCHNQELPLLQGKEHLFTIEPTFGLILHVTHERDQLNQATGSQGPMNAHIRPLLKGMSAGGREVSAPVVLIEHNKGDFAGGRWLFVNQQLTDRFWSGAGADALAEWVAFCSRGVTELWIKPSYAVYYEAERPYLTLQAQQIKAAYGYEQSSKQENWSMAISIYKQGETKAVWEHQLSVSVGSEIEYMSFSVPLAIEPGLYEIVCEAEAESGEKRVLRQGFWGYDRDLLERGTPLAVGRDYFEKNGAPFPIVGMTYMTSDVGRKFVSMPNAAIWDQDMATMKEPGINLIRTGLWTAWRHLMFEDGHASEELLRAVDAFILTAAKHEIEMTFSFFAFAPEAWEGKNPYLDPRSVQAQKRFIAAIVSRHKHTSNVQWDLINEPSLFDHMRIFSGPRSMHDPFEKAAYVNWLKQRHASIGKLQARWNMTSTELPDFEAITLPEQTDIAFDIQDVKKLKKNTRWLDYTRFTMDMHNRWVGELTATIHAISPRQLVTVGQDEALGMGPRPSPLIYAESVDYTTVHTWWLNDRLLWDSVYGKDPSKPTLIQETGIMYVEMPDNRAKRSEEELRNILERKYAYAFAAGGAGAVQWLWNTNYFMDNVCESNIGALRADGTQKPEADVSYDFGKFIGHISSLFEERQLEEIAVVFPYSNDFSSRRFACEATGNLTRVLGYEMKLPHRGIGEFHLETLQRDKPKLIIVPSAHNFSDAALTELLAHVEAHGGTLLFTGPIGLDEYWKPTSRAESIVGPYRLSNISREETLQIGEHTFKASFGGKKIGELNKEITLDSSGSYSDGISTVRTIAHGLGKVMWCPLPLELNERTDTLIALYEAALHEAEDLKPGIVWEAGGDHPGIFGSKLQFKQGSLYTFISEAGMDCPITVRDAKTNKSYSFVLESERSVLFATDLEGNVLASYRDIIV
ncbi:beta-galactosidase [Paenibacillus sp. 2TAB26]|uniref:beta-galactosidase n=1 Tax=Paenibacillus sp. 2TAB26 TaxID=3233005 RepID=UPI003F9E095C